MTPACFAFQFSATIWLTLYWRHIGIINLKHSFAISHFKGSHALFLYFITANPKTKENWSVCSFPKTLHGKERFFPALEKDYPFTEKKNDYVPAVSKAVFPLVNSIKAAGASSTCQPILPALTITVSHFSTLLSKKMETVSHANGRTASPDIASQPKQFADWDHLH